MTSIPASPVTRGLDPRVHLLGKRMDCRVKPGNDVGYQQDTHQGRRCTLAPHSRILMQPTSVHSSAKRLCCNHGYSHLAAPPGTAPGGSEPIDLCANCGRTARRCLHVLASD